MSEKASCFSFTASFFSTIAFALSAASNFFCDNVIVQPTIGTGDNLVLPERPFGPFYMRDTFSAVVSGGGGTYLVIGDACAYYPAGTTMDSNWNSTRGLAIAAIVIGAIVSLISYFPPCMGKAGAYAPIIGSFFMLTLILQGCTFLFLSSNACNNNTVVEDSGVLSTAYADTCVWGWGTRTNIAGCVFWFLAGMMTCMLPVIAKKDEAPRALADEETPAEDKAEVEEQPAAEEGD